MNSSPTTPALSREQFLANLADSQLLRPQELAWFATSPHQGADGQSLVEAGLLTPYQVDAIRQGRQRLLRAGPYDVLERLGAGGMGTVYKARHRRMNRVVALKALSAELGRDLEFVRRFQREVETIARLSHPNIVIAHDAGEAELGHFLVMEFVEGSDLASLVERQGPLGAHQAIDCILQAARGLAYAHGRGLVHRDVKPHNLLLDQSGTLKITDLGLARLARPGGRGSSHCITRVGGLLGTPDYMPPEQATDPTQIDHRADIYALGCTLHFLLTGSPPFTGPSGVAVVIKHRAASVPSLLAARPDVPAELDRLFRRMLDKSPEGRPQSAGEVADGLAALLPLASRVAPPASGPVNAGGRSTANGRAARETASGVREAHAPSALLVEPSRVQGGIMRKYLEDQEISVLGVVPSGQDALRAFRSSGPDCIISAFHLPDMTGPELVRQVRREARGAAPGFIIVYSQQAPSDSVTQFSRAASLRKPFTAEQLFEAVSFVCARGVKAPPAPVDRSQVPVLLVDDSRAGRIVQRGILKRLGFRLFSEAEDGAQALAAISSAPAPFGLIVTDCNMPNVDGPALVRHLKQAPATAGVPVLMVTGEEDARALADIRALGVAGLFSKAYSFAEVQATIDRLF